MTTTHPFTLEEMMAIGDGEMSAADAQELAAHVEGCAECAEQVKQLREVSAAMAGWNAPQLSPRAERAMHEELRRMADGQGMGKRAPRLGRGRRRWRWWVLGGAGVPVAAVFLIGILSFLRPTRKTVSEPITVGNYNTPTAGGQGISAAGFGIGAGSPDYASRAQSQAVEERKEYAELAENIDGQPAADNNGSLETRAAQGPMIARTASLAIVVKDAGAARKSLDAILAREHGYAAQITVATPDNDEPSLQASLRIPAANLAAAMADLRALGRVANESESGEDVTQQHADLDQRLKTARETEERFRAILAQRTGKVSDVLEVEEAIARVRGEIESMEAEQTNLEHRVDFASIDLSLSEAASVSMGSSGSLTARARDAFVAGFRHAADTVVGIFLFVVAYGLTILIWFAILGVPAILLRRRYKRMQAKL